MKEQSDPSLWAITWSVLSAFFGVSNQKNYDRDNAYLEKAGFFPYLVIGIGLTLLLILILITIVIWVVP